MTNNLKIRTILKIHLIQAREKVDFYAHQRQENLIKRIIPETLGTLLLLSAKLDTVFNMQPVKTISSHIQKIPKSNVNYEEDNSIYFERFAFRI